MLIISQFLWVLNLEWLSWWFWLRVSHEVVVKLSARLQDLLPGWLSHRAGKLFQAGGWRFGSSPCRLVHKAG